MTRTYWLIDNGCLDLRRRFHIAVTADGEAMTVGAVAGVQAYKSHEEAAAEAARLAGEQPVRRLDESDPAAGGRG